MVNWSLIPSLRAIGCTAALGLSLALSGCQTARPVNIDGSFTTTPAFQSYTSSVVSLLPVEDGTKHLTATQHLTFFRQEIARQLPDRKIAATTPTWTDATVRGAAPAGESILTPSSLQAYAKASRDDAVLAVRIGKWDESTLMVDRRVRFQFEAALVASDGTQLWSGSIQGDVKAGGAGAAPLGREAAARSCIEIAVRELLLRLPERTVR